MASLADQYTYSQTTVLQNRVREALVSAVLAIQNEATSTAFHKDRAALAVQIVINMNGWLTQFALAVANDATVSSKIAVGGATSTDTDTDVSNAVSAAWNGFALR